MSKNRAVPRIHSDFPHVGNTCTWCRSPAPSPNDEHIIPESMDFLTFVSGVFGKKGRMKKVTSRGNVIAERGPSGPVIRMSCCRVAGKISFEDIVARLAASERALG